ncbi:MAG: cadherin repeat domain-containing protein [Planctomycetales bacterium]|nr:cadherin repeat domain-containing protein [Planctomycetales bacterium]
MIRKELLVIIGVGFAIILAVAFTYDKVSSMITKRETLLQQVQQEVKAKKLELTTGRLTTRTLTKFKQMSLPSDTVLAQSQYQAWLTEIVGIAELADPQVKVVTQSRLANDATQLTCNVSGKGDLEQVALLLYEFYRVDTLHRIRRFPLKPIPDTKQLDINMTVEALILPSSKMLDLPDAIPESDFDSMAVSAIGQRPFEDWAGPILNRNMFSPANRPPSLERVDRARTAVGESFSLNLRATDPDKLDQLTFELGEDAPREVRLDRRSGELRWRPEATGTYEIPVRVWDDGLPQLSDERTIQVTVEEPRPREEPVVETGPNFDDAKFTYAVAAIRTNGEWEVWLQVRTRGEVMKLREGDPIKIGSIDGRITHIELREFGLTNGEHTYQVRIGDPLVGISEPTTSTSGGGVLQSQPTSD